MLSRGSIRKILLTAAVLVMCVGIAQAQAKNVTLTYRIWDVNQAPAMREIAERFHEANPNITVNVEVTPWSQYWTSLEAAATGRNLPDLFWLNAWFVLYAENDQLMPLDNYIERDNVDLGNFPEKLVNNFVFNGTVYGLPKDFDTVGLWYNKEIFDEAGIAYPDESWDWDTLVEIAKKLTNEEKQVWGFNASPSQQSGYGSFVYQNGGYMISEDLTQAGWTDKNTMGALEFWRDLLFVHKVSPTVAQQTDTPGEALFEAGRLAMHINGSWNSIRFRDNEYTRDRVDVAVLPKGKQRAVIFNGLGNVIAANTKYPEEAWQFLKFLSSEEAHLIQGRTGTVIPAFNGTQQPWVESVPAFNLQAFVDMVEYGAAAPWHRESGKMGQIQTDWLNRVWSGELTVEQACEQLQAEYEALLSR